MNSNNLELTASNDLITIPEWVETANKVLIEKYSKIDLGDLPEHVNKKLEEAGFLDKHLLSSNYLQDFVQFLKTPLTSFTSTYNLNVISEILNNLKYAQYQFRQAQPPINTNELNQLINVLNLKFAFVHTLIKLDQYLKSDFVVRVSSNPVSFSRKNNEPEYISNNLIEIRMRIQELNDLLEENGETFSIDSDRFSDETVRIAAKGVSYFEAKCSQASFPDFIFNPENDTGYYPSMLANAKIAELDTSAIKTADDYITNAKANLFEKIKKRMALQNPNSISTEQKREVFNRGVAALCKIWGLPVQSYGKYTFEDSLLNILDEIETWYKEDALREELDLIRQSFIAEIITTKIGTKDTASNRFTLKEIISELRDPSAVIDSLRLQMFSNFIHDNVLKPISDFLCLVEDLPKDVTASLEKDLNELEGTKITLQNKAKECIKDIRLSLNQFNKPTH